MLKGLQNSRGFAMIYITHSEYIPFYQSADSMTTLSQTAAVRSQSFHPRSDQLDILTRPSCHLRDDSQLAAIGLQIERADVATING